MEEYETLISMLFEKDHSIAYQALLALEEDSERSGKGYQYMDTYVMLAKDPFSYRRARGLRLLACYAKWDVEHKLDAVIEEYLRCVEDEKPTCARQCIQYLPKIIDAKPEWTTRIRTYLKQVSICHHNDSMNKLLLTDIQKVLAFMDEKGAL